MMVPLHHALALVLQGLAQDVHRTIDLEGMPKRFAHREVWPPNAWRAVARDALKPGPLACTAPSLLSGTCAPIDILTDGAPFARLLFSHTSVSGMLLAPLTSAHRRATLLHAAHLLLEARTPHVTPL